MQKSSIGRRSSSNPVRVSVFDREDKGSTRTDPRRTQVLKNKGRSSSGDNSQIPRPRIRSLSTDTNRKSNLKLNQGKASLAQHGPTTPITPSTTNFNRAMLGLPTGSTLRGRSPSAERASSIGPKPTRKDSRPLNEKSYQMMMLRKVDGFFATIQQSTMLNSNGSLKSITLKTFVEVTGFLVKLLDVKHNLTIGNYVDELPKIAKKLHYPGVMTKSWLKTANAMHAWPQVLGWICWLVEICEARDMALDSFQVPNLPFVGTDEQIEEHRLTFESMLKCYCAWNEEKLDKEAALVKEYLQKMIDRKGVTEEEVERARIDLENESIKLCNIEEMESQINSEVKEQRNLLESLQRTEDKEISSSKELEEYLKALEKETKQMNIESERLGIEIEKQNLQQEQLRVAVESQPMSVSERNDILEKCNNIQNYMLQFDEVLTEIEKEVFTLDIKLSSTKNNIDKAVLAYNKDIFMHLDNDVGMDLEDLKMPEKEMIRNEIVEVLQAKASMMSDLKDSLRKRLEKMGSSIESNFKHLETLEERKKTLDDQNRDFIARLNEKKSLINDFKTEAKAKEGKLREQMNALESDIKRLKESIPNLSWTQEEVAEADDKLEALLRRKTFLKNQAMRFFDKFYQILEEHRRDLANMLEKLD